MRVVQAVQIDCIATFLATIRVLHLSSSATKRRAGSIPFADGTIVYFSGHPID